MRQRMLGDLPDDTLVVLYVGRLAPEKTIHLAAGVTKLKGVRCAFSPTPTFHTHFWYLWKAGPMRACTHPARRRWGYD